MNRKRIAGGLTFCTVVRHSQLARARVLADSVRAHHPGVPLFVLVLDPPLSGADGGEPFATITLDELSIPELARRRFLCSASELARVAKPYLLAHLLAHGASRLVYADPGLVVADNLRRLEHRLARHAILVAPHLSAPPGTVEDAGADNPPFVALARGTEVNAYLVWWRQQLEDATADKGEREYWAEQAWIDLVPEVERRDGPTGPERHYGWTRFDNGVTVNDLARRCYRKLEPTAAAAFGDPWRQPGGVSSLI